LVAQPVSRQFFGAIAGSEPLQKTVSRANSPTTNANQHGRSLQMKTEERTGTLEEPITPVAIHTDGSGPKIREVKLASERKRSRGLGEDKSFKLFSGMANRPLAEEIAGFVGVKLGECKLQRFAD